MRRFGKMMGRGLAFLLTGAVTASPCAAEVLSPVDELNEILARQMEQEAEYLPEQQLELSGLGEAIKENGMQVQIRGGLTEGTAELLGVEDEIRENSFLLLTMQADPKLKKWLLEGSVGAGEETYAEASFYGDQELLAISIPQLYTGALAVRAGNFREQYQNSALRQLLGDESEIPDITMEFYPDEIKTSSAADFEREIEVWSGQLQERSSVEKTETADETVYTVFVASEDIVDFYGLILDEYAELFQETGLMTEYELDDYEQETARMLEMLEAMYEDEIQVNFHVKDGLVEKIDYEMRLDSGEAQKILDAADVTEAAAADMAEPETEAAADMTEAAAADTAEPETEAAAAGIAAADTAESAGESATDTAEAADSEQAETTLTETVEGTLQEAGPVSVDVEFEDTDFVGTVLCELEYLEPANPTRGMSVQITVQADDGSEKIVFGGVKETTDTENGERTEFRMELTENDTVIYSGTPCWAEYNAENGSLNMAFEVEDSESGETVGLYLDSTVRKTEDVQGLVWNISRLALRADGEEAGIAAEVTIKAGAGLIETPENPRVVLELDTGALLGLLTEIQTNVDLMTQEQTEAGGFEGAGQTQSSAAGSEEEAAETAAETEESEAAETGAAETEEAAETGAAEEEAAETGAAAEEAETEAGNEAQEPQTQGAGSDDTEEGIGVQADGSTVIIGGADGPTAIFLAGKLG